MLCRQSTKELAKETGASARVGEESSCLLITIFLSRASLRSDWASNDKAMICIADLITFRFVHLPAAHGETTVNMAQATLLNWRTDNLMHAMMWSMAVGRKIAVSLLLISWDTDCLPDLGLLTCIASERFHRTSLLDWANVKDLGLLFGAMLSCVDPPRSLAFFRTIAVVIPCI